MGSEFDAASGFHYLFRQSIFATPWLDDLQVHSGTLAPVPVMFHRPTKNRALSKSHIFVHCATNRVPVKESFFTSSLLCPC